VDRRGGKAGCAGGGGDFFFAREGLHVDLAAHHGSEEELEGAQWEPAMRFVVDVDVREVKASFREPREAVAAGP